MRGECGDYAYVNYMQAEHRRLDDLIRRTLQALQVWEENDDASGTQPLIAGLSAIRQELAQHFAEEEAGGCLEEAVARCPSLSGEAKRIQAEHGRLVDSVDDLIQQCRRTRRRTRRDVRALEQELRAVAHELRRHEEEENQILERGFSVCLEHTDNPREVV